MSNPTELLPEPIQRTLAAVRRQWRPATLVAIGVVALAVAALFVLPKSYQSQALLFVKVGASSVTLDPTATTGQTISLYESRETEINSILEILTSREMLERTAMTIGPDVVLGDAPVAKREPASDLSDEEDSGVADDGNSLADVAPVALRSPHLDERAQQAIRELGQSIHIDAPKRSTIISVSGTAKSPELAQEIVATMLELYREEHLRANQTAGSYGFFEDQTKELYSRLEATSEQLLAKKNDAGVVLLDEQRKNVEKQLSDLADRLRVAQSEIVASTARIAALEDELTFLPERQESERTIGIANDAYDRMRDRLYELEIRERELKSRFTDSHPSVLAVLEQVRNARDVISQQAPERVQSRSVVPPARVKAQEELVDARSGRAGTTALVEKLESQQVELLDRLRRMNGEELEIARLDREKSVLESSYRIAAEKLEQARMQKALATGGVSNVNVIQPASFETKPVSPKSSAVLGAGLALALLSFFGVALLLDRLDDSVRSESDLARRLRIPSLATLPAAPSRQVSWN